MDALKREGDTGAPQAVGGLRVAWHAVTSWPELPLAVSGAVHLAVLAAAALVVARQGTRADVVTPLSLEVASARPSLDMGPVLERADLTAPEPALHDDSFFSEVDEEIDADGPVPPDAVAAEAPPPSVDVPAWTRPRLAARLPEEEVTRPVQAEEPLPTAPTSSYRPAEPVAHENPAPRYPRLARGRGLEGTSLLGVVVLPDGTVGGIEVVRTSGHRVLDEAAVTAVRRWRFRPARRDGASVEARVLLPVTFRLL
ncbi:MAG: energy transducer TonB [Planctomycetota bacterium]